MIVDEDTRDFHPIHLFFYARDKPVHIPNKYALFGRGWSASQRRALYRCPTNMSSGQRWQQERRKILRHNPAPRERAAVSQVKSTIVSMTETYHDTGKKARSHRNAK